MALGIDGLRIGMWTCPDAPTGCTVLLPPDGTVGAIAVRGAAPGTREAAALGPQGKVEVCHAVCLAGGSAYGLAVADGVMRWLEERGRGYPVGPAVVPIVGAAIVLDAGVSHPDRRPDAAAGRAACAGATDDEPREGDIGAGRGVTVAKVGGLGYAWRGGQGTAVREHQDLVVSALVINNAVGELVDDDGTLLAGSRAPEGTLRFPQDGPAALAQGTEWDPGTMAGGPSHNTVIGCIVTNARLSKAEVHRVADLGHSGIARALRPAHTSLDGDALFCLATGEVDVDNLDLVASLAAEAVAEAARRGPLKAHTHDGVPGLADGGPPT